MSESLEKFTSIAKEDHQRAKTLFFSEAFKEELLAEESKMTDELVSYTYHNKETEQE